MMNISGMNNQTNMQTNEFTTVQRRKRTVNEIKDQNINCRDCGTFFIFNISQQEFFKSKGFKDPVRCKGCKNKKKGIVTPEPPKNQVPQDMSIKCRDCCEPFIFTVEKQEVFKSRGFPPPIRCKGCREAKKIERNAIRTPFKPINQKLEIPSAPQKPTKTEKCDWANIVVKKTSKKLDFTEQTMKKQKVYDQPIISHPMYTKPKVEWVYPLDEGRVKYYSEEEAERDWIPDMEYDSEDYSEDY